MRIKGMRLRAGVTYAVHKLVKFPTDQAARKKESLLQLTGLFQGMTYDGPKFIRNGHTELFLAPLM